MRISMHTAGSIILPALHVAHEAYMKDAATCAAAGQLSLANQFLRQADEAKRTIALIEDSAE